MRRALLIAAAAALTATAALAAGCGSTTSGSASTDGKIPVVAAENMWGSIASQVGGNKVAVTSVIVDPATDPHSYEPKPSDSIAIAQSQLALVNGIGYDNWASKALSANPSNSRVVLNVGDVLGIKEGDNPHQWYSPASVQRVAAQLAADYSKIDPADAAYFKAQERAFEAKALAQYNALRHQITSKYSGVPVGYSENIFQPLGQSLGLSLPTPASLTKAIAEGTDVTAADKATADAQIRNHKVAVWVFNSQNSTPDVQRLTTEADAAHIPVVTVTETLTPPTASFQQWQVDQLQRLANALHQATGH